MEEDKNLEKNLDKSNEKLHISDVSSSVYNGFRPNYPISDDLEDLKRKYTPEQLQKMWDDCYPKSSEINGKVIITGTPK
jgi:hypothetical protein